MTILTFDVYPAPSYDHSKSTTERSGLHRLFSAAIVNRRFREKLLNEPEKAVAGGYLGQTFALSDQEKKIISNVRARDLTDFAQKVNQALKSV
jgi:hypothetical protein